MTKISAMCNVLITFTIILFSGCASVTQNHNELLQIVGDYFNVYSQRDDFKRFMSFYADNAQFEDIIYGASFETKQEIKEFLDWERGEFSVPSDERILTITTQVLEGNTAITQGFFHEFNYDGKKLGPWLFVIIQEFNPQNKIIKQTDWINYTPKEDFLGGENMNNVLINK
ncbi:nuclear transport factor 2-like protein [Cognaticolwellia mytili]|uniref:nuclear transport factor 2 family protein n=1 Tax=Cognaticolwellia mytili TaxID=1888913 RepID=UPI001F2186B9|nr:nuclear transport factor 2 family protein [Cognaticolwellia mytili]